MPVTLDFTEEQLCELWTQHTSLEDDPRDANKDLRVSFEDSDALRQELRIAPETDEEQPSLIEAPGSRATYERARSTPDSAWSHWSRIA
jgi:hypothetical protein